MGSVARRIENKRMSWQLQVGRRNYRTALRHRRAELKDVDIAREAQIQGQFELAKVRFNRADAHERAWKALSRAPRAPVATAVIADCLEEESERRHPPLDLPRGATWSEDGTIVTHGDFLETGEAAQ